MLICLKLESLTMISFTLTTLLLFSIQYFAYVEMTSSVEKELAVLNQNGFPGGILFDAVAEVTGSDRERIKEDNLWQNLQSQNIQEKVIEMGLKHAARQMNYSGGNRLANDDSDSEACSYSWIKWLPWYNCADNNKKEPSNKIELIKEQNYKCYKA